MYNYFVTGEEDKAIFSITGSIVTVEQAHGADEPYVQIKLVNKLNRAETKLMELVDQTN